MRFADAIDPCFRNQSVRTLALAFVALGLQTATSSVPLPQKFENPRVGISLRYPAGWFATRRPLTQLVSPAQAAAVASFSLRQRHVDTNCTPRRALARVGSRGAFIFLLEYSVERKSDFPPRPRHFVLPRKPRDFECLPRTYALLFRDRGRYFQAHVALGTRASQQTRAAVVAVLDSLVVKPR